MGTVNTPQSSPPVPMVSDLTPDALKLRFKARCLATNNIYQNWQIRVHRSLSWFKRAAAFGEEHPEAKFLFLWIALNSLYGRWNAEKNVPDLDGPSRRDFFRRICNDDAIAVGTVLHRCRPLLKKILGDPFLSSVFWRDTVNAKSKGRATEEVNHLDRNLRERDYCRLLDQVLERLFVLRGQIVHGASTGGSRLNRSSLKNALVMLDVLVPLVQHVTIEQGCGDNWPALCYPPVTE